MEEVVHLVGDDGEAVGPGKGHQGLSAVRREHAAGGVLEGRYGVEEYGSRQRVVVEHGFEGIGAEARLIGGDTYDAQVVVGEDITRQVVGGLFDEDGVACPGKQGTCHVQGLGSG